MKYIAVYLIANLFVTVFASCDTCATGMECCGSNCYDPTAKSCVNDVLCPKGYGVCRGNVCYDPNTTVCYSSPCYGFNDDYAHSSYDVLCQKGLAACGRGASAYCYNPEQYYCADASNSTVSARPADGIPCGNNTCTGDSLCCPDASQCYDPKTQVCYADPRGSGHARICGFTALNKPQQTCEYMPYIDSSLYACFDPDTDFCCQGSSPGGTGSTILSKADYAQCNYNNGCLEN